MTEFERSESRRDCGLRAAMRIGRAIAVSVTALLPVAAAASLTVATRSQARTRSDSSATTSVIFYGQVVDQSGDPAPNVTVLLQSGTGGVITQATSGSNGQYSMSVSPGTYELTISGYDGVIGKTYFVSDSIDLEQTLDATLYTPPDAIAQVSVADAQGNPVSGTEVTSAEGPNSKDPNSTICAPQIGPYQMVSGGPPTATGYSDTCDYAYTDSDGVATIPMFASGKGTFSAAGSVLGDTPITTPVTGDDNPESISLKPYTFSGVVLNDESQPVPDQEVQLRNIGAGTVVSADTDANGNFSLTAAAGVYDLQLDGALPNGGPDYTVNGNIALTDDDSVDLYTPPTGTVDVTVDDSTGAPVSGVQVSPGPNTAMGGTTATIPAYEMIGGEPSSGSGNGTERSSTTGSDGSAELTTFANGQQLQLEVAATGEYAKTTLDVAGPADDATESETIALQPPVVFSGQVVDQNGDPVSGTLVMLEQGADQSVDTALTDANGDFSITAEPGDYVVGISGYVNTGVGQLSWNVSGDLDLTGNLNTVLYAPTMSNTLQLTVQDGDGNPVSGITVTTSDEQSDNSSITESAGDSLQSSPSCDVSAYQMIKGELGSGAGWMQYEGTLSTDVNGQVTIPTCGASSDPGGTGEPLLVRLYPDANYASTTLTLADWELGASQYTATLLTTPTAPTDVAAAADGQQLAVSWSAPAADGGAAITGYTITATPATSAPAADASGARESAVRSTHAARRSVASSNPTPVPVAVTVGAGVESTALSGLAANTTYTVSVMASNVVGSGQIATTTATTGTTATGTATTGTATTGTTATGTATTGTTATGTTTTPSNPVAAPTTAQVLAALNRLLAVRGAGEKIGRLLKVGGIAMPFTAPSPGSLMVVWQVTVLAHHRKQVITIASGKLTVNRAGSHDVKIKLTAAGRGWLKSVRTLKIMVRSGFMPTGAKQTTAAMTVTLRR